MKRPQRVALLAVVAVLAGSQPILPAALNCVRTDPEGDAFWELSAQGVPAPPYQDIVQVEVAKVGKSVFVFGMEMAGAVPDNPTMLLSGVSLIAWSFRLDTDPTTAPAGYPVAPGVSERFEFLVRVIWDGESFRGELVDRRPLLEGQDALVTPVPFKISKATLSLSVESEALGDPATFQWGAGVNNRLPDQEENMGLSPIDVTDPPYTACPEM